MLLNLLVIHFAFGSPFGMYQITRGGNVRSARSAATVAAHFVLWPIFAVAFIRTWITINLQPAEIHLEQKIAKILYKIEEMAFAEGATASIFEFREVFSRFTSLTIELTHGEAANLPEEIFGISGHTNIPLGSACIARRTRQRTKFHQAQARCEFIEWISRLTSSNPNKDEILELVKQLSNLLDAQETLAELTPCSLGSHA